MFIIITMPAELFKILENGGVFIFYCCVINYHKLSSLKQKHKVLAGSTGFPILGLTGQNESSQPSRASAGEIYFHAHSGCWQH